MAETSKIEVHRVGLAEIQTLRERFLAENNFQIRFEACHTRGWADEFAVFFGGEKIGYGSVKGRDELDDRDSIFEFYLLPDHRVLAAEVFEKLATTSGACFVECQSNEPLLTSMLQRFCKNTRPEVVLFGEGEATDLKNPGCIFRPRTSADRSIFEHQTEPVGDFVLEKNGLVVATGGFFQHYNPPFADLYMEVHPDFRHRGLGSFLLQELKKACRVAGKIPAARCRLENAASRATLRRAGFAEVGFMLFGELN